MANRRERARRRSRRRRSGCGLQPAPVPPPSAGAVGAGPRSPRPLPQAQWVPPETRPLSAGAGAGPRGAGGAGGQAPAAPAASLCLGRASPSPALGRPDRWPPAAARRAERLCRPTATLHPTTAPGVPPPGAQRWEAGGASPHSGPRCLETPTHK